MFIVDSGQFRNALRKKGFRSIEELAKKLGLHRNTIYYYLSGHPVLPKSFERVIRMLDLRPGDLLVEKGDSELLPFREIAPIVDRLHAEFPSVTFILFGSRVREKAHRYSDWDIGVYLHQGLNHSVYRRIVRRKNDLIEDLPFLMDIVNLNRADHAFLKQASKGWKFLTGRQQDWMELQRMVLT